MRVFLRSTRWIFLNQKEAIKILAEATGYSVKDVTDSWEIINYLYPPYVNLKTTRQFLDDLISLRKIREDTVKDRAELMRRVFDYSIMDKIFVQHGSVPFRFVNPKSTFNLKTDLESYKHGANW